MRSTPLRHTVVAVTVGLLVSANIATVTPAGYAATTCPTVDPITHVVTPAPVTDARWSGCSLAGASLVGADLTNVALNQTDFTNADLTNANLSTANLLSATLTGATLTNANFTNSVLTNIFSGGIHGTPATLPTGWHLVGGYLVGYSANLSNSQLSGLNLSGMNLNASSLTNAQLVNTNFTNASLSGVSLYSANASGANFTGAEMSSTNFTNANIEGALLTPRSLNLATSGSISGTPAALTTGWKLVAGYLAGPGAILVNANFANADLTNADMTGARLGSANFNHANLTDANLTDATLDAVDLNATTMTRTNLHGVLSGRIIGTPTVLPANWTLSRGYLLGPSANLAYAQLQCTAANYALTCSDLTNADLAGAQLLGANLSGANLTNVNFTNAILTQTTMACIHYPAPNDIGPCTNVAGATFAGATLDGLAAKGLLGNPASLPIGWTLISGYLIGPGANLSGASLIGADLHGLNLSHADVSLANLTSANLLGANLTSLRAINTIWYHATCPDGKKAEKHNAIACTKPLDTTKPKASLTRPTATFLTSTTAPITVTWTSTDGVGSGVANVDVRINRGHVGDVISSTWTTLGTFPTTVTTTVTPAAGFRYCFGVRARDNAGNVGLWSTTRCTNVAIDDSALTASPGWARTKSTGFLAGTSSTSTKLGATLTSSRVSATQIGVIASTCGTCGLVTAYIGTQKVGSFSLYSPLSATPRKLFLLPRFTTRKLGPVRLVVTANPNAPGRYVQIDGLVVSSI